MMKIEPFYSLELLLPPIFLTIGLFSICVTPVHKNINQGFNHTHKRAHTYTHTTFLTSKATKTSFILIFNPESHKMSVWLTYGNQMIISWWQESWTTWILLFISYAARVHLSLAGFKKAFVWPFLPLFSTLTLDLFFFFSLSWQWSFL
jgi:ABC-type maltose transport system permease subunit